jgi:hypothetical protein
MELISINSYLRMDDLDVPVKAMVDSGATGNFVSQAFVDTMCLPATCLMHELPVRSANGLTVPCTESLSETIVGIIGDNDARLVELDLIVVPDLKFDVVLGLPWLVQANPTINWRLRELTFPKDTGDHLDKERGSNLSLQNLNLSVNDRTLVQDPVKTAMDTGEILSKERGSNGYPLQLNVSDKQRDTLESPKRNSDDSNLSVDVSLPDCLKEFASVCEEKETEELPPERNYDLEINLKDSKLTPPFLKIYPLSKFEEDHLKDWVEQGLKKGFIRPSNSPSAAPIFFVKKKNGKLRPCIDYRQLNSNTIKDGHPLPLISDVLAKFKDS